MLSRRLVSFWIVWDQIICVSVSLSHTPNFSWKCDNIIHLYIFYIFTHTRVYTLHTFYTSAIFTYLSKHSTLCKIHSKCHLHLVITTITPTYNFILITFIFFLLQIKRDSAYQHGKVKITTNQFSSLKQNFKEHQSVIKQMLKIIMIN